MDILTQIQEVLHQELSAADFALLQGNVRLHSAKIASSLVRLTAEIRLVGGLLPLYRRVTVENGEMDIESDWLIPGGIALPTFEEARLFTTRYQPVLQAADIHHHIREQVQEIAVTIAGLGAGAVIETTWKQEDIAAAWLVFPDESCTPLTIESFKLMFNTQIIQPLEENIYREGRYAVHWYYGLGYEGVAV